MRASENSLTVARLLHAQVASRVPTRTLGSGAPSLLPEAIVSTKVARVGDAIVPKV
jgi:hypothetical protein